MDIDLREILRRTSLLRSRSLLPLLSGRWKEFQSSIRREEKIHLEIARQLLPVCSRDLLSLSRHYGEPQEQIHACQEMHEFSMALGKHLSYILLNQN